MQNKVLKIAIVFSIAIHLLFIGVNRYNYFDKKSSQVPFEKEKKHTIVKIKTTSNKQIVQTAESEKKEPVKDSFLSEKNNTFERQTRARILDKFQVAQKTGKAQNKKAKKAESSGAKTLAKLGLGMPEVAQSLKKAVQKNSDADSELLREVSSLASSSNDYVKDVPLADVSRFNTVEYRHYGFYQRIRSQLELHWGASLKEKAKRIYKTGRKIASDSDFITNMEVILDQSGKITGMKIIGTSGVKELDDAAIESFNKAGPFPNPPKDLISNGIAIIKWGFVVKS